MDDCCAIVQQTHPVPGIQFVQGVLADALGEVDRKTVPELRRTVVPVGVRQGLQQGTRPEQRILRRAKGPGEPVARADR